MEDLGQIKTMDQIGDIGHVEDIGQVKEFEEHYGKKEENNNSKNRLGNLEYDFYEKLQKEEDEEEDDGLVREVCV